MREATTPSNATHRLDAAADVTRDGPAVRTVGTPGRGWVGATLIAVAVVAGLALLLLYVPHWLLVRLHGVPRGVRVGLATGWTIAVTAAMIVVAARVTRPRDPTP